MSFIWCGSSIILGLILLAVGIVNKVKMQIPFVGTISGPLGAILIILGFVGGVFGFCPI